MSLQSYQSPGGLEHLSCKSEEVERQVRCYRDFYGEEEWGPAKDVQMKRTQEQRAPKVYYWYAYHHQDYIQGLQDSRLGEEAYTEECT